MEHVSTKIQLSDEDTWQGKMLKEFALGVNSIRKKINSLRKKGN
jgi:hypothetical protein